MAKNFYAVKRGFDKKQNKEITDLIADDWYKVAPLVKGYKDARYKGFDTKEEAETWLSVVDKTDAEKRAKNTIDQAKKDLGIEWLEPEKEPEKNVYEIANDYIDTLKKLLKEYKELNYTFNEAVGYFTRVLIEQATKVFQ